MKSEGGGIAFEEAIAGEEGVGAVVGWGERREKSEISMQERKRKGNVTSEAARPAPFDSGGVSPTGVGDLGLRLMMREFLGTAGLCKEIERDV